jgi:hypothetical protein
VIVADRLLAPVPRGLRDVLHLEVRSDDGDTEDAARLVAGVREAGRPLVLTVHDLRDTRRVEREAYDRRLDTLVPAADAVVTFTAGAAGEVQHRWRRVARVLPHPHVVPLPAMRAAGAMRAVHRRGPRLRTFRVGLHVGSLGADVDPRPLVPALVEAVRELPGAALQVDGHRDALEEGGERFDAALAGLLRSYAERGDVDLRVHDPLHGAALWTHLASLDVSVLPHRFGTHSRWLEACRDLGTTVVAPTCGYFAQQAPVLTYGHDETGFDARSLVEAVRDAYAGHVPPPPSVEERLRQRAMITSAHRAIHADAVSAVR